MTVNSLPANYLSEISKLLDSLDARPRRSQSPRGLAHRGELGDFNSIVCFQAAIRGLEDVLGPDGASVVLIRAGRLRGQALVDDWGISHLKLPIEKIGLLLDAALGHDGTRLCAVRSIRRQDQDIYVDVAETICSAGLAESTGQAREVEMRCSYTLGAVWGVLEGLLGETFQAAQVKNVRCGDPYDEFQFRHR